MNRLTPDDALFLEIEDQSDAHMHVACVMRFDGPAPAQDAVVQLVSARLHRLSRYRQRLAFVPGGAARPCWVDDPDFEVSEHVRRTALAAPGGDAELKALVGRLLSARLDRDRALWELWVVEHGGDERFSLVMKLHHCMVDGVSGIDAIGVLLDLEPTPPSDPEPPVWEPEPWPSAARRLLDAGGARLGDGLGAARFALRAGATPSALLEDVRALGESARAVLASRTRPAPGSSLNGDVGRHRRYDWVDLDLDEVKAVRRAHGVTINDVVLGVVAGGLRRLLEHRREPVPPSLRAMVPVSVRTAESRSAVGNQTAAVYPEIALQPEDPAVRLQTIHASMLEIKAGRQALGAKRLLELTGYAPSLVTGMVAREAMSSRVFNLTVTNVPGPPVPLYFLGARLVAMSPVVPLGAQHGLGIAIFSYAGRLTMGLLGDDRLMPDLDVLADAMREAFVELQPAG